MSREWMKERINTERMYNGRMNHDQMNQKLTYIPNKRKYLFCADRMGREALYPLIQQAMQENATFDVHVLEHITPELEEVTPEQEEFFSRWFEQQKMGTYLYLSGSWEMVQKVERIATQQGFSEQEMQVIGRGSRRKKILCCQCHGINPIEMDDPSPIICQHCGLGLSVSDHYSRRLDAYLGYVAKL